MRRAALVQSAGATSIAMIHLQLRQQEQAISAVSEESVSRLA
jgi:hypothetical protein